MCYLTLQIQGTSAISKDSFRGQASVSCKAHPLRILYKLGSFPQRPTSTFSCEFFYAKSPKALTRSARKNTSNSKKGGSVFTVGESPRGHGNANIASDKDLGFQNTPPSLVCDLTRARCTPKIELERVRLMHPPVCRAPEIKHTCKRTEMVGKETAKAGPKRT